MITVYLDDEGGACPGYNDILFHTGDSPEEAARTIDGALEHGLILRAVSFPEKSEEQFKAELDAWFAKEAAAMREALDDDREP